MTDVRLRVYDADLVTEVATLDQAYAIAWSRERRDVGAGEFTIPHDSPIVQANPGILDRDGLVVVEVDDGTTTRDEFAWVMRKRNRARGDVWDPIQVTGPGALELLRYALVYTYGGLDAIIQPDERLFAWQTFDYDDSDASWEQVDGARIGDALSTPGFVDDHAVGFEPASTTRHLYRRRLLASSDLAGPARMLLAATVGTKVTVYLDGDKIMEKKAGEQGLVTLDIEYREVDQQIAFRVEGDEGPQPGRWGWTWVELVDSGDPDNPEYGSVIRRTFDPAEFPDADSDWLVYDDDDCPEVTPGFIVSTLMDEWHARGGLTAITYDFDGDVDSAGNPWDGLCEFVAQVGDDNVTSVIERLRDHGIDAEVTADLVLRLWQDRGADRGGTPESGATTVTFDLDTVQRATIDTEDDAVNVILSRTDEAWIERPSPRVESDRREGFLSLGLTPSAEGGVRITDDVLTEFTEPAVSLRWTVNSAQTPPWASRDYNAGDTVQGPYVDPAAIAGDWTLADVRIDKIAAAVDSIGGIDWVIEASPASDTESPV